MCRAYNSCVRPVPPLGPLIGIVIDSTLSVQLSAVSELSDVLRFLGLFAGVDTELLMLGYSSGLEIPSKHNTPARSTPMLTILQNKSLSVGFLCMQTSIAGGLMQSAWRLQGVDQF